MEMDKVLYMNGGQGEYSYAQNSNLVQKKALLIAKPLLEESIRSWKNTFNCQTLRIADLGKSIKKYVHQGMSVPEFQFFYNDLPSNDFNSLFRLLLAEKSCNLLAGVPGSFYTRLFPLNSLHFIHSAFGIHWLSQIPSEVEDKNSEAWNRGRICISEEGSAGVADAYFAQFQRDLNAFLKARAKEMVVGGRMFLLFVTRLSADRRKQPHVFVDSLAGAMIELASQGIIEEEKLDSFNIPLYFPNNEEVRSELYKEGSFAIIGGLESFAHEVDDHYDNDKEAYASLLSNHVRAVFEGLLLHHFGEGVINDLFVAHTTLIANNMEEVMKIWKKAKYIMTLTLERKDASKMEMEKVLSMNGGQGEYSYAQNSNLVQKKILLTAKPLLEESIRSWKNTFNCETLCIADLGCSSGPNTLFITEIIAKEIQNKYINQGMRVPEFQVFYNDLPSNDFNSLFRLLLAEERSFNMAAGVPGSFYTRLFPLNSLHFIHSSFSLHWLSRVPSEVEDKNSKGWNRGRVFISEEGSESVADAYFAQFQRDLNAFLKERANEMVVG
ncbi:hypothetical protein KI387_010790, partial [Taxus chinensis]